MVCTVIVVILILVNLFSCGLMYYDKKCAIKRKWRVPEKTLFLAAACFGALGGVAGMFLFRHKTKHWYFRVFFPLMLVVQAAVIAALYIHFS